MILGRLMYEHCLPTVVPPVRDEGGYDTRMKKERRQHISQSIFL